MADGEGNPFLITPPPGLVPARTPSPDEAPGQPSQRGFIELPVGVADSATHRLPPTPRTGPVPTTRAFFSTPPGMIPVHPKPAPEAAPALVPALAPDAMPRVKPAAAEAAPSSAVTPAPITRPTVVQRPAVASLVLPDGSRHPIFDSILIGRHPSAPADWDDAELLGVIDPDKSVSKTHAGIRVDHDALWAHDLNSTNGVIVRRPDGREVAITPGGRTSVDLGDQVVLGQFVVVVAGG